MEEYYKILGVSRNASLKEIRSAFRKLSREYHPDVAKCDKTRAEEEFKRINEAYQILSDPSKRAKYDARPRPQVSRNRIHFGTLHQGDTRTEAFVVTNVGATFKEIDFVCNEEDSWFRITELVYSSSTEILPCEVKVTANTEDLAPEQRYEGWIEVNLDGVAVRVNLSICVKPPCFTFKSGEKANSPEDLVPLCERYWDEAKDYLYNDLAFRVWFDKLNRQDMLSILDACRTEKNRDVGLDKFLRRLDPTLDNPSVTISCSNTDFGTYDLSTWKSPKARVQIQNNGRGCCYGTLELRNAPWLDIFESEFAVAPGKELEITVKVNTNRLKWESKYHGQLVIRNNSSNLDTVTMDFSLTTRRHPERVHIESLLAEGKWRIAAEALHTLKEQGDWVESLERRADKVKENFMVTIIVGTLLVYGVIGLMAVEIVEYALIGAIAGPVGAIIYSLKWGGTKGSATDYALGGLAGIALLIGLYLTVVIIAIIIALLLLGFFLGGG